MVSLVPRESVTRRQNWDLRRRWAGAVAKRQSPLAGSAAARSALILTTACSGNAGRPRCGVPNREEPDYWRRRACRRMASTLAANAAGPMIGVPRHGDIESKSVSLEIRISAPTSAARSRIRLSS
jgi:hypothetical protein